MTNECDSGYDRVFVESVIEEINEMMMEKYSGEETVPLVGLVPKDSIPCDEGIWVRIFRTEDVKDRLKG